MKRVDVDEGLWMSWKDRSLIEVVGQEIWDGKGFLQLVFDGIG